MSVHRVKGCGTVNLVGDCCSVKVESGVIREKDKLLMQPQDVEVEVKAIEVHKKKVPFAYCG